MTRILVLPGIGDIYWIMVGLQGFLERHQLEDPEVHVWDFDGRQRGRDFVERIPWVRSGGYFSHPPYPGRTPEFHDTYMTGKRSIVPGFLDFDYYLAVNGALRRGQTISKALGDVATNWHFELTRTPAELAAEETFRAKYGAYIMAHFSDYGIFKPWVKAWSVKSCVNFLRPIRNALGYPILLTGCKWDAPFSQAIAREAGDGIISIAGETDADAFYGMLHGAAGVVGWCGGNTVLATHLRKPTLIAWSQRAFPDRAFYQVTCPPDTWETTYHAIAVEDVTASTAAARFLTVFNRAAAA